MGSREREPLAPQRPTPSAVPENALPGPIVQPGHQAGLLRALGNSSAEALLSPHPGEGSDNPTFDRWAAEQEASEHEYAEHDALTRSMRRPFRRRSDVVIRAAAAAAAAAPSEAEFIAQVWRTIFHSHTVEDARDVELFINLAVEQYGRARGYTSDGTFTLALGLKLQYAEELPKAQLAARRRRVGQLTKEIEDSPVRQANLLWQDQVTALATETGLDYAFVEEFLHAYKMAQKPRFPGTIDPRGIHIPFIHAAAPLSPYADEIMKALEIIKSLLPGIGLIEGIHGKDVLTGRELPLWERLLGAAADLVPLAGKAIGTGAKVAVRGVMAASRAVAAVGGVAVDWAVTALRLRMPAKAMLRYISRISRLSVDGIKNLHARISATLRTGKPVRLAPEERQLLGEIQQTHHELPGASGATPLQTQPPVPTASGIPASSPASKPKRRIGFLPPGTDPVAPVSDKLSPPIAGFGRPLQPSPPGVPGGPVTDMSSARVVASDIDAGSGVPVTSMSSGGRRRRGGGRRQPPLTPDERRMIMEHEERAARAAGRKEPSDTLHFGEREDLRGNVTPDELIRFQSEVSRYQHAEGTYARVKREGRGAYTVLIHKQDGGLVTVIRDQPKSEVRRLSVTYKWDPPFE